jgi:hypothetical protein
LEDFFVGDQGTSTPGADTGGNERPPASSFVGNELDEPRRIEPADLPPAAHSRDEIFAYLPGA